MSVKTQISMKAPICGGDFPLRVLRRWIHTTNESVCLKYKYKIINTTKKADEDAIFYVKTQIGKNHKEEIS